jgi:hypothetical protein
MCEPLQRGVGLFLIGPCNIPFKWARARICIFSRLPILILYNVYAGKIPA